MTKLVSISPPEGNVNQENLKPLGYQASVDKNPITKILVTRIGFLDHSFQQIAILIDEKRGEEAAPEEEEAHAEVENRVKMFSSQYFPDKDIAGNSAENGVYPFQ